MKQHLNEELREISPFLHDMKAKGDDGFRVPDGYFAEMENEVFAALDAIGARRKIAPMPSFSTRLGNWLARLWQPKLALAFAGLFAVVLAAWWVFRAAPVPETLAPIAALEISGEEAEAFVLAHVADFEPKQLAPENIAEVTNPVRETLEKNGLRPEDVSHLLDDMTDKELEELL